MMAIYVVIAISCRVCIIIIVLDSWGKAHRVHEHGNYAIIASTGDRSHVTHTVPFCTKVFVCNKVFPTHTKADSFHMK